MRIIFIGMLLVMAALTVDGQSLLSRHAFENRTTADSVAANLSVSQVSISSGTIGFQPGSDENGDTIGNASSWNQGNFLFSGKYIQFTITPQNGYSISLSSLGFRFGRSSAGPNRVTIACSIDGFDEDTTYLLDSGTVSSTNAAALNVFNISSNLPGSTSNPITIRIWGHNATSTGNLRFNNFRVFGTLTAPSPAINLSPSTLNGFSTDSSRASTAQSFQLSGNNFTSSGNLLVDASGTAYEVSSNNSTFGAQLNVAYTAGNLVATTLYVRLKSGLANGTYNQQIAISGGGASIVNLNVNGTVSRPVVISAVAGGSLRLSVDSLVFGTTNELQRDSGFVTLYNEGSSTLQGRIRQFHLYNHQPFWTPDSVFSIAAGDSLRLKIYFTPRHNILNRGVLVVDVRTGTGPKYIRVRGQGTYSRSYYANSQNQTGAALVSALRTITGSPYQVLTYSGTNNARLRMFYIIDNWKVNGREPNHNEAFKNECVYTGRTISYNSQIGTGAINLSPYNMNTEHTWPQSMGADNDPMESDLHHLFVTDGGTNSARGNKPLGNVPSPTLTYPGGSKANSVVFEPRDVHKGPAARALFYFAMRYGNAGTTQFPWISPYENDLRQWHALYPPDSIARRRNNDVQTYQLNRNPFVDYPQLLDRITNLLTTSPGSPVMWGIYVPDSLLPGSLSVNQQRMYRVPVVNHGTETIELTGINVSGTGLSYTGGSSRSIAPGEVIELEVSMQFGTAGSPSGQLRFNTNVPGRSLVTLPLATTTERSRWNGTGNFSQAQNWNNGFVPVSSSQPLIESGSMSLSDTAVFASIEVNSGATLQLQAGAKLHTTANVMNNGTIRLENGASFYPADNAVLSGTGSYEVKRNGQNSNLRINLWSSPVENAAISTVFAGVNPIDIQQYQPGGNTLSAWQQATGHMQAGRGYSVAGAGQVTFTGKVHHGQYLPMATSGPNGYYLLGNPYPAPLSADAFLAFNGPQGLGITGGSLYFWSQQQNATGNNFASVDYAVWAGGTGVAGSGSNNGSAVPNGEIGVAQGFFVQGGNLNLDVYFENNMRSQGRSGQFFRAAGAVGRLWLNAVGQQQGFSQTAVVFRNDASLGNDPAFDAVRFNSNTAVSFSTLLNNQPLAIQAVPWPGAYGSLSCILHSAVSQEVVLKTDSLSGFDTEFDLYLEDRATSLFYNLRRDSAVLQLSAGNHSNRFFLHFGIGLASSLPQIEPQPGGFEAYTYGQTLYVKKAETGSVLRIYNIGGQKVAEFNLNGPDFQWALPAPGVYLLEWTCPTGIVRKKIAG
ncbi:MAG: hypothetical protein C0424_10735 [Sphingobacteriaceae bacterium]|nr:hypothetical protein [Sphingobacteriaceae bacterium]